jgi:hypothetical protein
MVDFENKRKEKSQKLEMERVEEDIKNDIRINIISVVNIEAKIKNQNQEKSLISVDMKRKRTNNN